MLSAASQVLIRNEELFTTGKWLLVNPTDGFVLSSLRQANVSVFHQYYDIYQQSCQQGQAEQHHFGAAYPTGSQFDGAVIYVPKSKEHLKMLIANVAACLNKNGNILLVGENKGGIKSAVKLLDSVCSQANKIDSARHCALFGGQIDKPVKVFDIVKWQTELPITVAGLSYKVCSLPGVFNHGSLDLGTQLLLENMPKTPNGRILDFGCGAGIIGCFLGLKNPNCEVVMSDVSALAIHCSEQSAKLNGLKADVLASNGLVNVSGKFLRIVTNPPFHTGIQTDYSVTEGFIQQLNKFITSSGDLVLVANNFLRYSELLEKRFSAVNLLKQTSKFSLYQCCRIK